MKISRSRIYKILNTHNQSMKKPRKSRNPKRRIKRSRKGGKRQRNLRYKTLKKKGGARIKLDSKTATANALIAGYQKALSTYVDALKQNNERTQIILSGQESPGLDHFTRLLKTTLAKGIAEEVEKAQSADKNVLQKVVDGITSIFTRSDAGAKQSFSQQLNDIVEREKLIHVVQTQLTYANSAVDRQGKYIVNAINSELQSIPEMSEMLQRLGFGVGMDPYFDLEISKQEVIVDNAINQAADKVSELRLRLDTVTSEQKNELKNMLDNLAIEINKLLAMFGIFSGAGGGSVSLLDYQNAKLQGFGDNPASAGAMAFTINQKAIHEEVMEALVKKINESITFYPGQDIEGLIDTSFKSKNIERLVRVQEITVRPVGSNAWKTGNSQKSAAPNPLPIDNTSGNADDMPVDAEARASAEARLSSLERNQGIKPTMSRPSSPAPNVGVGPQSDEAWDDGGDNFTEPKPVPTSTAPVSKPKTNANSRPSSPLEVEMTDFSKKPDPEDTQASTSGAESNVSSTPTVTPAATQSKDGPKVESVSSAPVDIEMADLNPSAKGSSETPTVTPAATQSKDDEATVSSSLSQSGPAVIPETSNQEEGNILEKCDRPMTWQEIVAQKADGMAIYLCPAFTNDTYNASDYGGINFKNISGRETFCGFIALTTYLIDVSEQYPEYWQNITGTRDDPHYWLYTLVEEAKNGKSLENGAITYPVDIMNGFMVTLRTLDNNPSRDRFMYDSDMTALAKITNVTYCVWERTNAIGSGWTYISESPKPGIIFPPMPNPPPPCLLVHDSSDTAVALTGHYDYIDSVGGRLKTYLSMPDEMFQQAYAISQARRPTAAAQAQAQYSANASTATSASTTSASADTEGNAKNEKQSKASNSKSEEPIIDDRFPFEDAVKSKEVCKAMLHSGAPEIAAGACAPNEVFINYFTILGLEQPKEWDRSFEQSVKKSYRKKSLIYHPDKSNGQPGYEARFKCIKEAYAVLSNQKLYNRYIRLMPLCIKEQEAKTKNTTQPPPPNASPNPPPNASSSSGTSQVPPNASSSSATNQPPPNQGNTGGPSYREPTEYDVPNDQSETNPTSSDSQNQGTQATATDSNDQQTSATETSGVSTKSTTTRMPNGDVEVNIRVKIPKDAQFSINGNAGSPTETVMRGLVDNINQKGGTKKKRPRRKKQTRRKKA